MTSLGSRWSKSAKSAMLPCSRVSIDTVFSGVPDLTSTKPQFANSSIFSEERSTLLEKGWILRGTRPFTTGTTAQLGLGTFYLLSRAVSCADTPWDFNWEGSPRGKYRPNSHEFKLLLLAGGLILGRMHQHGYSNGSPIFSPFPPARLE